MIKNRDNIFFDSTMCEDSPLRKLDPRCKLFMSLVASVAVMLPLVQIAIFFTLYLIYIFWAGLFTKFIRQIYRMKWILFFLFIVDWLAVNLNLAGLVTLRLILLTSVFTTLFATTTPAELGLACERMHIPYRYSFSINLAFQSLGLLQVEWNAIWEAQKSRGVLPHINNLRSLFQRIGDLVALTVPAIVLTTRRAWAITESAYARGFDSPRRIAYHKLQMLSLDWVAMLIPTLIVLIMFIWR
ncbi:MAG: energy-coupling factor transporter transmembrane component T [Ignavibacteria bacterium]|nr:energy-coupling factor transporter transmembrane component T [Ignavibacteria bacterium]